MDGHGLTGAAQVVNLVANLVIVLGYVLVPFTVLRYLPLSVQVRVAGLFFFLTCAMTHVSMAFGWQHDGWMVVNHVVQAAAVVWFVLSFWLLLRRALDRSGLNRRG